MRKVLHKVKSRWVVVGIMGTTVVALGTANVQVVSADQIDGITVTEAISGIELGTAFVTLETTEKNDHIGIENAIVTTTSDETATVFVYWNEDDTASVSVEGTNGDVIYSELLNDTASENRITVLNEGMDYYTIEVAVTNTVAEPIEETETAESLAVEEPLVEETSVPETKEVKTLSGTEAEDTASISRETDAINTSSLEIKGSQIYSSSELQVKEMLVNSEVQVANHVVTEESISKNIQEPERLSKAALTVQVQAETVPIIYAQITAETIVDYSAMISRGTDAINTAPWGAKGYQTIGSSADYVEKTVAVSKEQVMDYGVTWALISLDGKELGWVAKDALTIQADPHIVLEKAVDYPAVISRGTDAINTAPWGVKGYQTVGYSGDYVGKTVAASKEQVTDYGVTWAQISLEGKELGWIAKDALTVQAYAQIVSETVVDYSASIQRGTDAINTAPWGTKGYKTINLSAAYVGETVTVSKEQLTDYGVTWILISKSGQEIGWIAKDAVSVQKYAQVVSEKDVDYPATILRGTDAINTAPWAAKGYQTVASSSTYMGKTVAVSKEQVMDYGVTWALISLDGKELGWIAKDALIEGKYVQVLSSTEVAYDAVVTNGIDAINTKPWGTKAFKTIGTSADYLNEEVIVSQEQLADNGVTWALISKDGREIGWLAKNALTKINYVQILSTTDVSYDAVVTRGTDGINTKPWGTKGFETVGTSADYINSEVTVSQEQLADNGVTWAFVSKDGKALGWMAKDALTVLKRTTETLIDQESIVTFEIVNQEDATMLSGERVVVQAGANGYDTIIYDVVHLNGVETSRVEVSRETTAPVNEIVKVGTKTVVATIGNLIIEKLSVDASGIYEGYNSKDVVLRMTATSKGVNLTYAYVNYDSTNGYSDQVYFDKVENNAFEATIPLSSQYSRAGLYQVSLIGVMDSIGNTWVIFPEGNGSGMNYTSADLSTGDFTIKETSGIASVAGITLETIAIESPVVYVDEWTSNKVTMKVTSDHDPITEASISYTLPNGWTNSSEFINIGNDIYEAAITPYPSFLVGAGAYTIESISVTDSSGDYVIFFPEGFGTGLNYDSGDLSGGDFEAKERLEITTEYTAVYEDATFETIYQDDPNMLVGESKVVQFGSVGTHLNYYTITYTNGIETSRELTGSTVVMSPITEIIAIGSKQPIAQIGGFTLEGLFVDSRTIYEGEWGNDKLVTMKLSSLSSTIQNAYVNYKVPSGVYVQEEFIHVGNDTYEAAVPTYFWSAGLYKTDSIVLIDSNGNSWVIFPEGNGSGYNYVSTDLNTGNFEVLSKYAVTTGTVQITEAEPFNTTQQLDPMLPEGDTKVIQTGVNGVRKDNYTITYTGGVETSRILDGSVIVTPPVDEIIAVGTKQPIAKVGGFTVKNLYFEEPVVYGGVKYTVLKMVATDNDSRIKVAHATYKLPQGGYTQFAFNNPGDGTLEALVPTYFGFGMYQLDSLYLEDVYGHWTPVMSTATNAYDSYFSHMYADLSEGDFFLQ